jgi:hypothetical protein
MLSGIDVSHSYIKFLTRSDATESANKFPWQIDENEINKKKLV